MPHRLRILKQIKSPADLRRLDETQLVQLADEVRECLLESVSATGGHLAAGLGTVELTIALHTVFNTPHDRLVWDVGHQSYLHKILTGRRDQMESLRQKDGLSGFPRRSESPYDSFGVGHSSTSISAALGMADSPFTNDMQEIRDLVVPGGANLQDLNLPIDPNGVVYDALGRAPVAGATLTLVDAASGAALPASCFEDPVQQGEVTRGDGYYKFDVNFSDAACPSGNGYAIAMTAPPSV